MDKIRNNRYLWFALVVVEGLVAVCVIGAGIGLALGAFDPIFQSLSTSSPPLDSPPPGPNAQPAATDSIDQAAEIPTPIPTSAPLALSPEDAAGLDSIEQEIAGLRRLTPNYPVRRALISQEQLRERLELDLFSSTSQQLAADTARVMSVFGLVPPDYDLLGFYQKVVAEQTTGIYEPAEDTLFVVGDQSLDGSARSAYAHEYVHALQDMFYDLENNLAMTGEACRGKADQCRALQALVEGDAFLTEQNWLMQYASEKDREQIKQTVQGGTSPALLSAPAYFKKDLGFPYLSGLRFLNTLIGSGDYGRIETFFTNPPVSTEQILHPERYPRDVPNEVSLPDIQAALGEGWRVLEEDNLGEWGLYLVLSSGHRETFRLADEIALAAAAGWGGDRYQVLGRDTGSDGAENTAEALYLVTTWDNSTEAFDFNTALLRYGELRWGQSQTQGKGIVWQTSRGPVGVIHRATKVYWIAAPDAAALNALLGLVP